MSASSIAVPHIFSDDSKSLINAPNTGAVDIDNSRSKRRCCLQYLKRNKESATRRLHSLKRRANMDWLKKPTTHSDQDSSKTTADPAPETPKYGASYDFKFDELDNGTIIEIVCGVLKFVFICVAGLFILVGAIAGNL